MKSKFKWLAMMLTASLLMNVVLLYRSGGLREQVENVRRSVQEIRFEMNSMQNSVSGQIAHMREQQQWLAAAAWTIDESAIEQGCQGPIPMTLDWSLRELPPQTAVHVEVRPGATGVWQAVPAEQTGSLAYRAWAQLDPKSEWQYRVVADGDGGARASDPRQISELHYLTMRHPLLTLAASSGTGSGQYYQFMLMNRAPRTTACNRIESVTLQVVQDGSVISAMNMVQGDRPITPIPSRDGTAGAEGSSQNATGSGSAKGGPQPAKTIEGPLDKMQWWSDWVQVPSGATVRALVQYAVGDQQFAASEFGDSQFRR